MSAAEAGTAEEVPIEASAPEPGERDSSDDATDEPARTDRLRRHETGQWAVATPAALLAAGLGIVTSRPALVLAAVVAVGLLAYRRASTEPSPALSVTRSLDAPDPDPGDVVTVETRIRNVGETTLPDCRLVDLVPSELSVVDGSPRVATAIRPGEACTIAYDVRAERGTHEFGGVHAVVADLANTVETEYRVDAPDELECVPSPTPLPATVLRSMTTPYAGRRSTDQPGEGIEFHATREYQRGDALRRIDWNQFASTGKLATLQFRTERAAAVVLLADVRPSAYVRADEGDEHAADRGVEAIGRLFVSLLDDDHRVGIATLGREFWLGPTGGSNHRVRGLTALGREPALSPAPSETEIPLRLWLRTLRRRVPNDAQVVLCSPLVDDAPATVVRVLESHGHEVTVISPDPTDDGTPGETVAAMERRRRVQQLQGIGVPVVDWPVDGSLDVSIARVAARWSG